MAPIEHIVGLSAVLFTIGVVGALTRRNLVAVLMSIELMLNAANLAFIAFNRVWAASPQGSAIDGQVFVLMVITVAAADAAVGLGMVIAIVRNRDSMNVEDMSLLKW
jgi:NADH-quinone oxidoreductase subunit K